MEFLSAGLAASIAVKVAAKLAADLIGASALPIRRLFATPEIAVALEAALRTAIEKSLSATAVPPLFIEAENGGEHFADLLGDFLGSEEVLTELCRWLDPRPGELPDLKAMLQAFAVEHPLEHFAGLDFETFLARLGQEFYAAAASEPRLQGVIQIRELREIAAGMGKLTGIAERSAVASESNAAATERVSEEIQRMGQSVTEAIAGRPAVLQQIVQVYIGGGAARTFEAYDLLRALLLGAGYAIEPEGVGVAIRPATGGEAPPALGGLQQVLVDLRRALAVAEPSESDLDRIEERYRAHLIRWFENLTFQGMMRTPKPIILPLEDVYVELRAVAEVPEGADTFSVEERRLLLEFEEREKDAGATELRRELLGQLDALRRERWSRSLPERQSMAEALHRPDRKALVILGDPGSGKTTLLHYLALVYARGPARAAEKLKVPPAEAERLPIFVPLAAYDEMRRRQPGLTLPDFLGRYYDLLHGLPGLGAVFARAIQSGRALVLFDGLDEVLDTGTRRFVAEQVGILVGEWVPRGVRFVLSSRVVGYREAPLTVPVTTLTVLDFGRPELEIFVRRWVRAYEKWAAGGESPEMLQKAHEHERNLLTDVRDNPGVRRLAANPLMLTMLALLRRQIGRLPHRRIQLYESYVGTLLENWVELRTHFAREEKLERLERTDAEGLLMPLALWLQREKPSGTAGREELRRQLVVVCLEETIAGAAPSAGQRREAERRADRFLREMREMTGILVERGQDAFGFLHLTFQEYFAGRALAALDEGPRWAVLKGRLHDPRWREPILLCAGRLGVVESRKAQVTALVRAIWKAEDPTEADLHRNLRLALAIAGDDVYVERALLEELVAATLEFLPSGVERLEREFLTQLALLVANGAVPLEGAFSHAWRSDNDGYRRRAVEALARYASLEKVREALVVRLEDPGVADVAIRALGPVAAMATGVRSAIFGNLEHKEDWRHRAAAVGALAGLARTDSEIRGALRRKLGDKDGDVRFAAVEALAPLLAEEGEIRSAILERLDDEDLRVCGAAGKALAERAVADPALLGLVIEKIGSWNSDSINWFALEQMSPLAGAAEGRRLLLSKLADGPSPWFLKPVIDALKPWAAADTEVRDALLSKLESGEVAAIHALATLAQDVQVREALLKALNKKEAWIRGAAIRAMASLSQGDSEIRSFLLESLEDPEYEARFEAVSALAGSAGETEVRHALRTKMSDCSYRLASLAAFPADVGVRKVLLERLKHRAPDVRKAAISALAFQASSDFEIRAALAVKLHDPLPGIRVAAIEALGKSAATYEEIRIVLLEKLQDVEANIRSAAARALSAIAPHHPEIRAALRKCLKSTDTQLRVTAFSALAFLVPTDPELRDFLIEQLEDQQLWSWAAGVLGPTLVVQPDARRRVLRKLEEGKPFVQNAAARALAPSIQEDSALRKALFARVVDDPDLLFILGRSTVGDVEIRAALRANLDHPDEYVRSRSILALRKEISSDSEVRYAVLERLSDEASSVRRAAVEALGNLASSDRQVRHAIAAKLKDPRSFVRQAAVAELASIAAEDLGILRQLAEMLASDDFDVRKEIVFGLAPLSDTGQAAQEFFEEIFSWLQIDHHFDSEPSKFRQTLADTLAPRFPTQVGLRQQVATWLDSPRRSARLGGLAALLAWPGGPPAEFLPRLCTFLEDRRDPRSFTLRLAAAAPLLNRNETCREAIEVCLEALDYRELPWEHLESQDSGIRSEAALLLGKLEPVYYDDRVYTRLLDVMKTDSNSKVRDAAYGALLRLALARE